MIRCIGSHLERRIHCYIERQLVCNGCVDPAVVAAPGLEILLEYSRGKVHRTAVQTGELQYGGMVRLRASESLVFSTSCRLVAYEVRVGPAQTGRTHGLVGIDHDVMTGRFSHCVEVVVYDPLAVMMFAVRKDVSDITALDGIVAIAVHKIVSGFHMTLVVAH